MSNDLYKRYFQLQTKVKAGEPVDPKHITALENSIQLRIYHLNELKEQVQVLDRLNEMNQNLKNPDNEDSAEHNASL